MRLQKTSPAQPTLRRAQAEEVKALHVDALAASWKSRTMSTDARNAATAAGLDPKLLEILVCPLTKGALRFDAGRMELISERAGLA
jgi:hypothetical protein